VDTPFIVPVVMFLSIAAMVILRGPLGKALADRIAGRRPEGPSREVGDHVTAELEEMRQRLSELENRVDFAERLLAKGRDADRVGPGR
jgi:hypothetical protein